MSAPRRRLAPVCYILGRFEPCGGIVRDIEHRENRLAYWRANLRLVALCLAVWFLCSYGFGILLVDELDRIRFGGFRLGFWFAQQGSMYGFVVIIFVYASRMAALDRKFGVHE